MKRFLPKSEFGRNVVTLATGTTIAQAIPIAVMPILTRIYTPEDIGVLAVYLAIVSIFASTVTGRFELAITLPNKDEDADNLVFLSLGIAIVLSFILFLIVFFFGDEIGNIFNTPEITSWLIFTPISIFLVSVYNTINYWFNRNKLYVGMSKNRIIQSSFISGIQVGSGFIKLNGGLIIGNVIGQLITTIMMLSIFIRNIKTKKNIDVLSIKQIAHRYRRHPYHLLPSHWIGASAMQMPVIIIATAFGAAAVGFFSLAQKMVTIPSSIIASAIGDVYRQEASLAYQEHGEFKDLFIKTLINTVKLAVIPFGVLFLIAPDIFSIVFGEQWRVAGEYARIIIIASFFQFIFTPLDKGALIVGATGYIFIWHVSRLLLLLMILIYTNINETNIEIIISFVCAAISLLYIIDGFVEYKFSKGEGL